jgi:5'-3' exonuclease
VDVQLVDGTYELFRHYYGQPSRRAADGSEIAATRGVLSTVLSMLESGATHVGVATDHVIESFRNDIWPGYKTSAGVPEQLLSQFTVLERCLEAMGVTLWPMTELEADDAIASAAAVAGDDPRVGQVRIWSPDKDLAQCVRDARVVQVDRRSKVVLDEDGVWTKFGVAPASIADWLGLVGDSADGFPGLAGWGKRSASLVLARYGTIDAVPDSLAEWDPALQRIHNATALATRLATERPLALLFRDIATLRVERTLLGDVDELAWGGPTPAFTDVSALIGEPRLAQRAAAAAALVHRA